MTVGNRAYHHQRMRRRSHIARSSIFASLTAGASPALLTLPSSSTGIPACAQVPQHTPQCLAIIATSFFSPLPYPLSGRPPVFLPPHGMSSRAQCGICSSAFARTVVAGSFGFAFASFASAFALPLPLPSPFEDGDSVRVAHDYSVRRGTRPPLSAVRSRLHGWLAMQPPDHFLLMEPNEELLSSTRRVKV